MMAVALLHLQGFNRFSCVPPCNRRSDKEYRGEFGQGSDTTRQVTLPRQFKLGMFPRERNLPKPPIASLLGLPRNVDRRTFTRLFVNGHRHRKSPTIGSSVHHEGMAPQRVCAYRSQTFTGSLGDPLLTTLRLVARQVSRWTSVFSGYLAPHTKV